VIPSGKRLQNRLIVGEGTAGPSRSLRPTLDQVVLVRIQVRQLPKSPILKGFSVTTFFLTFINPRRPSPRYGKRYGISQVKRMMSVACLGAFRSGRQARTATSHLSRLSIST
jgi:hypothetical protein